MLNQSKILELSPWVEVCVRSLYWRIPLLNKLLSRFVSGKSRAELPVTLQCRFDLVLDGLRENGLKSGEIIVVHSSGTALKPFGVRAEEVIESLHRACGQGGTLAVPAIRSYGAGNSSLSDTPTETISEPIEYDMRLTPTWTGALSRAMLARPDAEISGHPLNSMVAIGAKAKEMMLRNLEGDRPTACGVTSSWKYCVDHNALIVFLGVDAAHSLTAIHVAEDAYEDDWPFRKRWYRERTFKVIDDSQSRVVTVRERRPRWAMFYAERTLQRDLLRRGILRRFVVGGVEVQLMRAAELIAHLRSQPWKGYPYKVPFWMSRG